MISSIIQINGLFLIIMILHEQKFFTILLFFLSFVVAQKDPQKKVFIKNKSYQIEKDKIATSTKKISKVWFKIFLISKLQKKA